MSTFLEKTNHTKTDGGHKGKEWLYMLFMRKSPRSKFGLEPNHNNIGLWPYGPQEAQTWNKDDQEIF